jgi:hypothetical protein
VIVRREIRVVIVNILDMFLISLFLERRDQKERAGSSDLWGLWIYAKLIVGNYGNVSDRKRGPGWGVCCLEENLRKRRTSVLPLHMQHTGIYDCSFIIICILLDLFFNFAKNIPYSFIYSTGWVEKKMADYFANIYTSCIFWFEISRSFMTSSIVRSKFVWKCLVK